MTTNRLEATHMIQIMLKYQSPYVAKQMLKDMDFEIADTTDNESLKESIKMVLGLIDHAKSQVTWKYPDAIDVAVDAEDEKTDDKDEGIPDSNSYRDETYGGDDMELRKKDMTTRLNHTLKRAYKPSK